MADDLFRTPSMASKNMFEGSSGLSPDKEAVRTSPLVFDDNASKTRFASSSKTYLPVFDLVPKYDDDIFEGVPGTKNATAGSVSDDLFGVFEAGKSAAAPIQFGRTRGAEHTSKPSSGRGSTARRAMDVSSSASRDESNSFQSSKTRSGRHHTKYERWSQLPSSAVSGDSLHKPAKMYSPGDLSVDRFNPGNQQARESTILDSFDLFNMKDYIGGSNVRAMPNPFEDTKRPKENNASIEASQSTTMLKSSHSKASLNSYVRKLENGNIPSSKISSRIGVLDGSDSQHVNGNSLTTSTFSASVTPSTSASRKSQYNVHIDSRYSSSPIKSNEFLPGKLTPGTQTNLEHISKLSRQTELRGFEEVWLTIDNFRLVTKPTSAPPPSRSPPPFGLNREAVSMRRKSKSNQNRESDSKLLENEEPFLNAEVVDAFTKGRQAAKIHISGLPSFQEKEIKLSKAQLESTSRDFLARPLEQEVANLASASEMDVKDAIKRAEALLKLGKELEQKELLAKAADDSKYEEKENVVGDAQSLRKKEPNHTDAKERKLEQQGNLRQRVHEGMKNRSAFESANQEAHERAGQKASSETRDRAERAAVQQIAEEVRERAAAEAREKAAAKIKAVTEVREKAAAEARESATAEARDRAAMEARERVAAEDREKAALKAREQAAAEEWEIAQLRERGAAEAIGNAVTEAREKETAAAQAREKERAASEVRERERTSREARERERAAAESREKEVTEAREKAARELMEKLAIEAGEKAAVEARDKAVAEERVRMAEEAREKIAAEASAKAAAEKVAAQVRAERAAVQRANAEARERAAEKAKAEARQRAAERVAAEKVAAEGRTRGSVQKRRPATPDPMNASHPSKVFQNDEDRASTRDPPSMNTSPTIIPDDWMPFFVASPATEFPEMRGEHSDRTQVRLERHQRTTERMAKALAEKNQRDFEVQREQAEKQQAAETLDTEIRRWAAGKEGNLRALLSTLHYVLWPGCDWQPVSISDLVTAAAVKKIYRKATLCVHPDKVQQKGCSIQQKYIAEKVFDLLKEAWNKFNSEALFY